MGSLLQAEPRVARVGDGNAADVWKTERRQLQAMGAGSSPGSDWAGAVRAATGAAGPPASTGQHCASALIAFLWLFYYCVIIYFFLFVIDDFSSAILLGLPKCHESLSPSLRRLCETEGGESNAIRFPTPLHHLFSFGERRECVGCCPQITQHTPGRARSLISALHPRSCHVVRRMARTLWSLSSAQHFCL